MNTVSHVQKTPFEKQLKQSAKAIKSALKELHNFDINHTQSLEISARSYGFKNWNVASAAAKKTSSPLTENKDQPHTPSKQKTSTMGNVARLHLMENHFGELGYPDLKTACKAIVGSNGDGTKLSYSIWEESIKETEGIWRCTWLPHKITILQNEELFNKIALDFGFDATDFIKRLINEIVSVENYISSNKQSENRLSEAIPTRPIDKILSIFNDIQGMVQFSQEMHDYVNSLSKEDYALLAATYDLGRQGWDRDYYESNEYEMFVENMASDSQKVTQEMADKKFLPKETKQKQFDWLYQHMLKDAIKYDGAYKHNWLSQKINLISETYAGIGMLHEL